MNFNLSKMLSAKQKMQIQSDLLQVNGKLEAGYLTLSEVEMSLNSCGKYYTLLKKDLCEGIKIQINKQLDKVPQSYRYSRIYVSVVLSFKNGKVSSWKFERHSAGTHGNKPYRLYATTDFLRELSARIFKDVYVINKDLQF